MNTTAKDSGQTEGGEGGGKGHLQHQLKGERSSRIIKVTSKTVKKEPEMGRDKVCKYKMYLKEYQSSRWDYELVIENATLNIKVVFVKHAYLGIKSSTFGKKEHFKILYIRYLWVNYFIFKTRNRRSFSEIKVEMHIFLQEFKGTCEAVQFFLKKLLKKWLCILWWPKNSMGKKSRWKWVMSKNSIHQKESLCLVRKLCQIGHWAVCPWNGHWPGWTLQHRVQSVAFAPPHFSSANSAFSPCHPITKACALLSKQICPQPMEYVSGKPAGLLCCPIFSTFLIFFMLHPETCLQKLTGHFHLDAKLYFLLRLWLFCQNASLIIGQVYRVSSTFLEMKRGWGWDTLGEMQPLLRT